MTINFIKKLPVPTILHENINFILFSNDLINLSNVFMKKIFLKLNLFLNCLQLIMLVVFDCAYLNSNSFPC